MEASTFQVAGADKTANVKAARVTAIDTLRGLVMVLMALDHSREFFTSFPGNPLDPQRTTLMLFTSRWLTHLCAPVFVLLAGTSIYLQEQRKTRRELTWALVTRGLWLVVVELTLVHIVFNFSWRWDVQLLEVIWAIGASMVMMAAVIQWPVRWVLVAAVTLIASHDALDAVMPAALGTVGWLWSLLHVPGALTGAPVRPPIVIVAYPLIPWVGVMALGYVFGTVVRQPARQRIRFEWRTGVLMLTAFVLLRWSNIYGDPAPWTAQATWWRSILSFLNVQKYPPSLLFLLATLGIAALLMAGMEWAEEHARWPRIRGVLQIYGRVPFFYFLLHLAVIHLLALIVSAASGGDWRWWLEEIPKGGVLTGRPPGYGYGLAVVAFVWVLVVAVCYPACRWYAGVRARSRSRLFSFL